MAQLMLALILLFQQGTKTAATLDTCGAADFNDPKGAAEFLATLQRAVAKNDRGLVLSLIQFPIMYKGSLLEQKDFSRRYDEILNPEALQALSQQQISDVYCDSIGLAIGRGEIWFSQLPGGHEFKVTVLYQNRYARAGVQSFTEADSVDEFFLKFQAAMAHEDRPAVASMIEYPLEVATQKGTAVVRNKADLLKRYDFVFNAKVKRKLAMRNLHDLFATDHGIGVGDGEIWIGAPDPSRKLGPVVMGVSH